ncbi:hypothetical protein [Cohnella rhizosphaerae]|uniref:Uncharacterized protein n=1 Tax=Cohnella rhizosphaerae TaxID=1457232 RepID=A0A9X4QSR8_9BACL|nr:hypothetical protein [Cohnella rhizosphaerae]MDG0808872.1 hypothetical protein [Cohnella rhizosphaerae]
MGEPRLRARPPHERKQRCRIRGQPQLCVGQGNREQAVRFAAGQLQQRRLGGIGAFGQITLRHSLRIFRQASLPRG